MKKLLLTMLLLTCMITYAQEVKDNTTFDEKLAKELGADEYGMKKYVIAFLKRGPNRDRTPEESAKLQRAHLDNIKRMAEEGKLVLAGPFLDDGDIRGIYIFNVETVEEAQKLTETDPAIQAGSLVMELHPWYGTATLLVLKNYYDKVAKTKI
ncbi:MAG: hypothetical protein KDC47_05665 [Flavobacteriaceae bacterium]|nr:hypothetical protein [Flavobacteriaceae bacterium]